jgi:3-methyladenine DNA glycosylase AlkD
MAPNDVLTWLRKKGSRRTLDSMGRYGITARHAFGVPMGALLSLSKRIGADHELATALWDSGWYEARLLAALVGQPERLTRRQMNAWAGSFENWGDCDTVCFKLFDRTPLAWEMAPRWAGSPREFVKRGGFVLMACLALHDKDAPDRRLLAFLPAIHSGANDERNFVKKGVNWALRAIGERSATLNRAAVTVATRLARSEGAAPRWVGQDALRHLEGSKVRLRLARRSRG